MLMHKICTSTLNKVSYVDVLQQHYSKYSFISVVSAAQEQKHCLQEKEYHRQWREQYIM